MEMVRIPQAARELGVSRGTLITLIESGRGPKTVRIGDWRRIRRSDLEAFIQAHTISPLKAV